MDKAATLAKHRLTAKSTTGFDLCLSALIVVFCVWYAQFLWKRRHWYWYSFKTPGPISFPIIGSALSYLGTRDNFFDAFDQTFKKYGQSVKIWFGTQLICGLCSPEHVHTVLKHSKALEKSKYYEVLLRVFLPEGSFLAPVKKWKKVRKIVTPTFNQQVLNQYVEIFNAKSKTLAEHFEKVAGNGVFDVCEMMSGCTMDMICETVFGIEVHAQEGECMYHKWVHRLMEISCIRAFNIQYHSEAIFNMSVLGKETADILSKGRQFAINIIEQRKAEYEQKRILGKFPDNEFSRKSFFFFFFEQRYNGESKLTDEEISNEVNIIIIGGLDTNAISNCFTLLLLGMHPEIQQRVYNEIIDVIGPSRDIQYADLPNLIYLERVIKETLRIFPVAPVIGRLAEEDIDLGDQVIPAGTQILLGLYWVHKDERYYADPFKFDPDRFLPEEVAKRHPGAFIPFSFGARNCIGAKYGMMAMKTTLATIIRKYKIYTLYKSVEEVKVTMDLMLKPADGYKVHIEKRKL